MDQVVEAVSETQERVEQQDGAHDRLVRSGVAADVGAAGAVKVGDMFQNDLVAPAANFVLGKIR